MIAHVLQGLLAAVAAMLVWGWAQAFKGAMRFATGPIPLITGAVANFLDTLGIGSFAPTTAVIKIFRLTDDDTRIPGTLNVGHAIPTITQAIIFISIVRVDVALLVSCIVASIAGALLGVRIVTRLPVRAIRLAMGLAMLVAAGLYAAKNLGWIPGGNEGALGLEGGLFALATALHFVYGVLMMVGVGLYAPSLITLSLLGMNPTAGFPIMMGACAFLMPSASLAFLRSGKLEPRIALGLALGGIPGVLVAAFVVKSLSLDILRWGVVVVVIIAAATMLAGAFGSPRKSDLK
ncbi:MAG: sulfite exporter TauE/SafE family protein [Holophagaceae bacterium]|nr:sulfite exporter TauE/SafE family protein [Holophagaceae bacterium]